MLHFTFTKVAHTVLKNPRSEEANWKWIFLNIHGILNSGSYSENHLYKTEIYVYIQKNNP